MEQATAARCPGCGFENNPFYRYCGMCGHPLRAGDPPLPPIPEGPTPPARAPAAYQQEPVARPETPVRESNRGAPPITISGLSILGLGQGDETAESAPEEQATQEAPHFRDNGNSRQHDFGGSLGRRDADSHLPSAHDIRYLLEDDEPRRSPTRMYFALLLLAVALGALVWHWQTNGYPWESAVRESSRRTGAGQEKIAAPMPQPVAAIPNPAENAPKPTAAVPSPAAAPEPVSAAGLPAARTDAPSAAPEAEAVPPVKEPAPTRRRSEAAPAEPRASAKPAPEASPNDPARLFAEGEKYLYGDGVPRDCDRAQKDLRTAAAHSYAQAESLLGTMYASGHCLGRDLPAAYRWYARALRHDQGNSRISSDLEVLWGQMTPAERKAAQSGGQ